MIRFLFVLGNFLEDPSVNHFVMLTSPLKITLNIILCYEFTFVILYQCSSSVLMVIHCICSLDVVYVMESCCTSKMFTLSKIFVFPVSTWPSTQMTGDRRLSVDRLASALTRLF